MTTAAVQALAAREADAGRTALLEHLGDGQVECSTCGGFGLEGEGADAATCRDCDGHCWLVRCGACGTERAPAGGCHGCES